MISEFDSARLEGGPLPPDRAYRIVATTAPVANGPELVIRDEQSSSAEKHADQDRSDAAPLQQRYPLAQYESREGECDQRVGAG